MGKVNNIGKMGLFSSANSLKALRYTVSSSGRMALHTWANSTRTVYKERANSRTRTTDITMENGRTI
jgi:hypothetical protein